MTEDATPLHVEIRNRCQALGISQQQLGRAIGLSQNSVSRLLRGRQSIAVDQIRPLEQALLWPWGTVARRLGLTPDAEPVAGDVEGTIRVSDINFDMQLVLIEAYRYFTRSTSAHSNRAHLASTMH